MTAQPGAMVAGSNTSENASRGLLAARILRHAIDSPHRVAISVDDTTLVYAELAQQALALAQSWPPSEVAGGKPPAGKAGVSDECTDAATVLPEPLVALEAPNHIAFAVIYLACVAAGTVLALIDPGWTTKRRRQLLEPFRPMACYDAGGCDSLTAGPGANATDSMHPADWPTAWHQMLGEELDPRLDDACFLLGFTSGSSGQPKAFIRRQHSWRHSLNASRREFGIGTDDCVIAPGPLSHGLSFYAMVESLSAGASFHSLSKFEVNPLLALLRSQRGSTLVLVPTMLHRLLEAGVDPLGRVRRIITAGAKLLPAMLEQLRGLFPQATISEYYGASELSFVSVMHHPPCPANGALANSSASNASSVGRAFQGVELSIRDDNGRRCGIGETGFVSVRSQMLAEGYLMVSEGRPELQLLPTLADTVNVGDVGYLDASQQLFLTGRRDRIINSGALKISAEQVEAVLADLPLPGAYAVFGNPSTEWGQQISIALECAPDALVGTAREQLIAGVNAVSWHRLQRHERPRYLFLCPSLPRTHSGKLSFSEIPDTVLQNGVKMLRLSSR